MNDFRDVMKEKSNSELMEILSKFRDEYQPSAIQAAEEELKIRNISEVDLEVANNEIEERELEKEKRALRPLNFRDKLKLILLALFPFLGWNQLFVIAQEYEYLGFNKKSKDAKKLFWKILLVFYGIPTITMLLFYLAKSL